MCKVNLPTNKRQNQMRVLLTFVLNKIFLPFLTKLSNVVIYANTNIQASMRLYYNYRLTCQTLTFRIHQTSGISKKDERCSGKPISITV